MWPLGTTDRQYTRQAFNAMARRLPDLRWLEATVGPAIGSELLGVYFEEALGKRDPGGWWSTQGLTAARIPSSATSAIKVRGSDLARFEQHIAGLCKAERLLIEVRRGQVERLLERARAGQLRDELKRNAEPAAKDAPGLAAPAKAQWRQVGHMKYDKAPPGPASPFDIALAWATRRTGRDKSAYRRVLEQYVAKNGARPLGGGERDLTDIWRALVTNAPRYRSTVIGAMYPSSIGGAHLLKETFKKTSEVTYPTQGDAAWADWAVFYFGAVLMLQAFPDGNKRVADLVYALMMLSGGIEFVAPTDEWGRRLAGM